jgi:hypothetical protein
VTRTHTTRSSRHYQTRRQQHIKVELWKGSDVTTLVTFEVHVDTILAAPRLALADDGGGHDLLPEVGLPLLDSGHDHVADAGGRQPVQPPLNALDGDDVEVLGPGVVGAVHRRRHRQTQRHAELVPRGSSPPCRHSISTQMQSKSARRATVVRIPDRRGEQGARTALRHGDGGGAKREGSARVCTGAGW